MAKYIVDDYQLSNIADAIRDKNGTSDPLTLSGMVSAISDLGGGGPFDLNAYFDGTLSEVNDVNGEIKSLGKYITKSYYNYYNHYSQNFRELCLNGFSNLSYVYLPSCSYVGVNGLTYCQSLDVVSLPNLKSIGIGGMYSVSISDLYMPNVSQVYSIHGYIGNLTVPSDIKSMCLILYSSNGNRLNYASMNGSSQYFLCSWNQSILYSYIQVNTICTGAFSSNYTLSGYINNSYVKIVCDYATGIMNTSYATWYSVGTFGNSTNFKSISIPNCEYIGTYAFVMSSNNTLSYLNLENCKYIGMGAFVKYNTSYNTQLTSVNMKHIEYIGSYAFANYQKMKLDDADFTNCSYIGLDAFRSNQSIYEIPSTITSNCLFLGGFMCCPNLSTFNCNAGGEVIISSGCSNLTEVSLPYATYISIYNCSKVSSIYAPVAEGCYLYSLNSVNELDLPNLKYGTIASMGNISYLSLSKFEYINSWGFCNNMSSLTSVSLPNFKYVSVTQSGGMFGYGIMSYIDLPNLEYINTQYSNGQYNYYGGGFWNLSLVESVNLPELKSCCGLLFNNCSVLSSVTLPKLKSIYGQMNGYGLFNNCPSLTGTLDLPELEFIQDDHGGEQMGQTAALGSVNFNTVKLYKVSYINSRFFTGMSSLESVYLYMSSVCQFVSTYYYYSLFDRTPIVNSTYLGHFGSIYVPSSLYSDYKNHSLWRQWSSRFVSMSDADYE